VKGYFGITAPDNQLGRRSSCSLRSKNWYQLDNQLEVVVEKGLVWLSKHWSNNQLGECVALWSSLISISKCLERSWSNLCSLRMQDHNWLNNQLEADDRIIWRNEVFARYDAVEELTSEISKIRVCFDTILWKSVEIQIRNHPKGVALMKILTGYKGVKFKTLMLTRHHSEGAACLVKFMVTINEIYSSFLWWMVVWKHIIQVHSFGWFANRFATWFIRWIAHWFLKSNQIKWFTRAWFPATELTYECMWMTCRKKDCQRHQELQKSRHCIQSLWFNWCPINILKCSQFCLCNLAKNWISLTIRMSDCCLQGITPCEWKGKG